MQYSTLASNLPVNQILAFNNQVKSRVDAGESLYNFTIGDFDPEIFPIPEELEEGIIQAYQSHQTNYPMAAGLPELRQAVSGFAADRLGLDCAPSDILVAAGGRPLIYATYQVLVDPGDSVVYPVPSWNNQYYACFTQANTITVETRAADGFMPTAADLAPHIRGAVLLALCSPQNPTGTCFQAEQLKDICELVLAENQRRGREEKKLYILYDQIYHLLTYQDSVHVHPVGVCPQMQPYTIYIEAISKSFAATGLRVGWAYGPTGFMDKMKVVLSHMGAWAPRPAQSGLAAFLSNTPAVDRFLKGFRYELLLRLQKFYEGFMKMKAAGLPVDAIAPQASLYLSINIDVPMDMSRLLLEQAGIAVLAFPLFGAAHAPHWYRISVGTCRLESIPLVLERIEAVIEYQLTGAAGR
ncbi:pyridoxal phosphate-dependent aminotransferase [Niabella terrae]